MANEELIKFNDLEYIVNCVHNEKLIIKVTNEL